MSESYLKKTTSADIFEQMRREIAQERANNTRARPTTPEFIFQAPDLILLTDDIDESVLQGTGLFQIDGDFYVANGIESATNKTGGDFAGGTGNFNEPDQPLAIEFGNIG